MKRKRDEEEEEENSRKKQKNKGWDVCCHLVRSAETLGLEKWQWEETTSLLNGTERCLEKPSTACKCNDETGRKTSCGCSGVGGNFLAQQIRGIMAFRCMYGVADPQDEFEAVHLAREATDVSALAKVVMADALSQGVGGLGKELENAVALARNAAEEGNPAGQNHLGWMYLNGIGLEKCPKTALLWYKKAAACNYAPALSNIGWCWQNGLGVGETSFPNAKEYFERAAAMGFAVAQNNLAWMYHFARGVEKDVPRAAELYQLAADQGHGHALSNLGWLMEQGDGITKDLDRAFVCYKRAAERGNAAGQCWLARMYENGHLTLQRDLTLAMKYYHLSADQGFHYAVERLWRLYSSGSLGWDHMESLQWVSFLSSDNAFHPHRFHRWSATIRPLDNNNFDMQTLTPPIDPHHVI